MPDLTAPRKIRVLTVDDSTVVRRILADVLGSDPQIEVAGSAPNGRVALAKLPQLNPDAVTIDIEMPEMDGLQTLRELRKQYPRLPVIMFSTLTERGAVATLDALSLGANDYVTKPANVGSVMAAMEAIRQSLIPKIKSLCPQIISAAPAPLAAVGPGKLAAPRVMRPKQRPIEIVAIATSTGGPNALAAVIPLLPKDFSVPIVIVQHMPPVFTTHLAKRLDGSSQISVQEGRAGELLKPSQAWIAPGDYHMTVLKSSAGATLMTNQGPPESSCRPAADPLFRSVAEVYGAGALAVVMTGMGCDGLRGCQAIRAAGGRVLVQDQATSVVWGMPGAVAGADLADDIQPLGAIADRIVKEVGAARKSPQLMVSR